MAKYSTHLSLIERISSGVDPAAWHDFQDRYGQLIRSFARRKGLQDTDCDDVLQEVLTSLSRALPGFTYDPNKGLFRSYLKTITLRATFARKNKYRPNIGLPDGEQMDAKTEEIWEQEWRQYHLRLAMNTIRNEFNSKDVHAFVEYAQHGNSAEATAEKLNLSVHQVYQAKSRIIKRLSAIIEEQVQEEG